MLLHAGIERANFADGKFGKISNTKYMVCIITFKI